eukprot:6906020-Prymnesium_polylepis.3
MSSACCTALASHEADTDLHSVRRRGVRAHGRACARVTATTTLLGLGGVVMSRGSLLPARCCSSDRRRPRMCVTTHFAHERSRAALLTSARGL